MKKSGASNKQILPEATIFFFSLADESFVMKQLKSFWIKTFDECKKQTRNVTKNSQALVYILSEFFIPPYSTVNKRIYEVNQ